MYSKLIIFVVISVLIVTLVHSSFSTYYVFAVPPDPGWGPSGTCGASTTDPRDGKTKTTCCWTELESGQGHIRLRESVNYCQTCTSGQVNDCGPKQRQGLVEQPPTPPPSGPAAPLQDGGVLQQPPTQGVAPPLTRGQGDLPEEGVLQQLPTDETTQPPAEPLTDCLEGQVLDEETGLCVLEEPEVAEEPEQSEPEEQEQQPQQEEAEESSSEEEE